MQMKELNDKKRPEAQVQLPPYASHSGYVQQMDGGKVGISLLGLGGGRLRATDCIDHRVGLNELWRVGIFADSGQPLAWVQAPLHQAEGCRALLLETINTGAQPPVPHPIVLGEVGACHGPSF